MILRDLGDDEALYRFIVPRWSHAPTSGAGAAVKGGRFNRQGVEALYLSLTAATATATALEEYRQHARLVPPGTLATFLVSRLRAVDFSAGYAAGKWHPLWGRLRMQLASARLCPGRRAGQLGLGRLGDRCRSRWHPVPVDGLPW